MQFSENWLRSLVGTELDSDALYHILTMAGLEVEEVKAVAPPFSQVVVAKIITAEKHPDADRLQVCSVDVGLQAPLQIVCGAPNARAGLMVPCALVGAALPGIAINQAKVRGVESFGMLCSAKELGIADEATGLLELSTNAQIGQDIREYLDLNDHSITIKLTPNRADCLSLIGIARDVAAITGAQIKPLDIAMKHGVSSNLSTLPITIDAPTACPKYCGRFIANVNARATTPLWMHRRLARSGIRSVNALVDITNYVLIALGQPMHAFDADKLMGPLAVRLANQDEPLTLLNDEAVTLKADDLVIADTSGAIALAGIMGGASTAVSDSTTNVFLESAFFSPAVIAGKARRLGLSTDASYRFERGVDFGNTKQALEYATQLIFDICGGEACQVGEITEIVADLPMRAKVTLRVARLNSILGIAYSQQQVAQLLKQLNFSFEVLDDTFIVSAPSYRFDITIEADLIEEIARLHGYDHIPAIAPIASVTMLPTPETIVHSMTLRQQLVAFGYQEVINYSFVDARWERDLCNNLSPIRLQNPIASHLSVMRTSLWGGLIDSLQYNLNRKQERAQLFELGATYHKSADAFVERQKIAGLFYGTFMPEQWASPSTEVDFYDVKAHVMALAGQTLSFEKAIHPALHPGQSAQIHQAGQPIGWLGKLHPKWQQQYGLVKNTFLFELAVDALQQKSVAKFTEVSKLLAVRRDIAVLVDENIALATVIATIKGAKIPLVQHIELFDLYQGAGVAENKKSLALSVLMHDTQRTLTDEDADKTMAILLQLLAEKFSATLR